MQSPIVRLLFRKSVSFERTPRLNWKPRKSKLSKQLFPKLKICPPEEESIYTMAPPTDLSSYQLLTEGHVEVIVEKKPHKINLTELLRDLYTKFYDLRAQVAQLTERLEIQKTSGGPDSA